MSRTTFSGPVRSNNGFLSNHVTFDTDTTYDNGKGTLTWNQNSDTLQLDLGNGVELELGQEFFFQVRNNTGSQIDKGTAVQFTGALGNSGRITVGPALASPSTPPEYFIGVSAENIPNDSDGRITFFGKIRGLTPVAGQRTGRMAIFFTPAGHRLASLQRSSHLAQPQIYWLPLLLMLRLMVLSWLDRLIHCQSMS